MLSTARIAPLLKSFQLLLLLQHHLLKGQTARSITLEMHSSDAPVGRQFSDVCTETGSEAALLLHSQDELLYMLLFHEGWDSDLLDEVHVSFYSIEL